MRKILLVLFVLTFAVAGADANWLQNAGFETPALPDGGSHTMRSGTTNYNDTYVFWNGWGQSWNPGNGVEIIDPLPASPLNPIPGGENVLQAGFGHGVLSNAMPATVGNVGIGDTIHFEVDYYASGCLETGVSGSLVQMYLFLGDWSGAVDGVSFLIDTNGQWIHEEADITLPSGYDYSSGLALRMIHQTWGAPGSDYGSHVYMDNAVVVPEPATMALLALGGLAAIRRRR